MILFIGPFRVCSLLWFTVTYAHELICLIMSPLYRGGDIALSLTAQFVRSVLCLCGLSIYRTGGHRRRANINPALASRSYCTVRALYEK